MGEESVIPGGPLLPAATTAAAAAAAAAVVEHSTTAVTTVVVDDNNNKAVIPIAPVHTTTATTFTDQALVLGRIVVRDARASLHQFLLGGGDTADARSPKPRSAGSFFVRRLLGGGAGAVAVVVLATTIGHRPTGSTVFWWWWWLPSILGAAAIRFAVRTLAHAVGTALGVALGLGWAMHVYEQLDVWTLRQEQQLQLELEQLQLEQEEQWHHQQSDDGLGPLPNFLHHNNNNNHAMYTTTTTPSNYSRGGGMGRSFSSSRVGGSNASLRQKQQMGPRGGSSMSMTSGRAASAMSVLGPSSTFLQSNSNIGSSQQQPELWQDEQSYHSLMMSAGYHISRYSTTTPSSSSGLPAAERFAATATTPAASEFPGPPHLLRGQVYRPDQIPRCVRYPFTDPTAGAAPSSWKAVVAMRDMWPTLPGCVSVALGQCVEYILRDFVAAWYSKVDAGCHYTPTPTDATTTFTSTTPPEPTTTTAMATTATTTNAATTPTPSNDTASSSFFVESPPKSSTIAKTNCVAPPLFSRVMMYSIAVYKPLPFYDALYESCAVIFGNLATRVEHVNIFELLLLKWTRVLALTFKSYRSLRKHIVKPLPTNKQNNPANDNSTSAAVATTTPTTDGSSRSGLAGSVSSFGPLQRAKSQSQRRSGGRMTDSVSSPVDESNSEEQKVRNNNSTNTHVPVSEIAMTKEFLFAGKLHRALTFGMDVPAFLFTDANGQQCGTPKKAADGSLILEQTSSNDCADDQVLAARLFETNLIAECEIDYNRVLGHRMVRALISRGDFGSGIVSSILTEIMAGCVLTPIMSLFAPETINSWIIAGLADAKPSPSSTVVEGATSINPNEGTAASTLNTPPKETQFIGTTIDEDEDVGDAIEIVLDRDYDREIVHQRQRTDTDIPVETCQTVTCPEGDGNELNQKRTESEGPADTLDPLSESPSGANNIVSVSDSALDVIEEQDMTQGEASTLLDVTSPGSISSLDNITMSLSKALIDLQEFVDLEESRIAWASKQSTNVDWDTAACRAAVVQVVLVVEAALNNGRCSYRPKNDDEREVTVREDDAMYSKFDDGGQAVEVTLPEYETTPLTQVLMELTDSVDAFSLRVASESVALREKVDCHLANMILEPYNPSLTDQSTLRTLIAVWLHSRTIYKTMMLFVQANVSILMPYYEKTAFLRSREHANEFVRQLRTLDDIQIIVDTLCLQASPRLEDVNGSDLEVLVKRSAQQSFISPPSPPQNTAQLVWSKTNLPSMNSTQFMASSSTPRYLDFNRNESFAASLRSERDRRMLSWERTVNESTEEGVPVIHRKRGVTDEEKAAHNELHHIARIFFAGTNMIALRDAGRLSNVEHREGESQSVQSSVASESSEPFALLLVETVCPKRRLEIPDDDSSFLLRAQPRPLNAVGVHRDQRNHDQSFKCFAATYDEPVLNTVAEKYNGGRYIRRCLIRYYPIDRTASVAVQNDVRKMDQRKSSSTVPATITLGRASRSAPFLSDDFLKERHLCNRVQQKGSTKPQSILSSSVMEATDFTAWPRPGKAIDFLYRINFYERPGLDLGGKRFTAADSSSLGAHRADASSLEMSDASLGAALLLLGSDNEEGGGDGGKSATRRRVEMGKDGYPVVWMKYSRNQDDAQVELKQYRTSFVRAALLVTSARHEAQQRALVQCVKAGSAKKANKVLTDAYLKPTLKLVDYAGDPSRGKQSILLRDLKLGVNNIDRGQLRRNALLSPRFPTELIDLSSVVEEVAESPDTKGGGDLFGASSPLFKIKCVAEVMLVASDEELCNEIGYKTANGEFAETYKEEWVIYRTMKEFQALHKHLKTQVSMTESSGTAGSRLVGAATAAFSTTTTLGSKVRQQRKMLIPSLSNASKAGALGVAKKLTFRRKEILDGYLGYLLSPGHLLGRCSELLLFLGANFPLAPTVRLGGEVIHRTTDLLGRTEMTRSVLRFGPQHNHLDAPAVAASRESPPQRRVNRYTSVTSIQSVDSQDDDMLDDDDDGDFNRKLGTNIIPEVKHKIDKVMLAQVRHRVFELLRYQFGFENASFARNRLLAALKTASFAVTTPADFRKMLYKLHTEHLNAQAVAGWIDFLCNTLWPNGVFFESKPLPSQEELQAQVEVTKELLHRSFPDQVRTILGQDLTRDGMDIFHEMLQNRMVVKSMAYMLFDLLWLDVFPEIGDVLSCGSALDLDA